MPRSREPYLDNVKGVLVTGVVVAHAIGPVSGVPAKSTLFAALVSVLMPAFVVVAGHLSRRFELTGASVARLAGQLLVPLVVVAVLQALARGLLLDGGFAVHVLEPAWSLWFLWALFWWRLLTPLLRAALARARFLALAATLAISLVTVLGPGVGQVAAAGRTLAYLPLFALGLALTDDDVGRLRFPSRRTSAVAAGCAVLWVAGLVAVLATATSSAFFAAHGATGLGVDDATAVAVRALLLATGLAGAVALAAVVPGGRSPLTSVGQRSLYVYLLQAVVLYPLRPGQAVGWADSVAGLAVVVVGAVVLAFVLGSAPVARATRWIVEPLRPRSGRALSREPATP